VAGYLAWYFRSFTRALLAMIPVLFAVLSMLGIMHLLHMRLNYLNIIAIPMIVGIGVDSAIHLLARFYEGEQHNMRIAIEKTGRAIVITSLTTIFGFGSLSVASFSGIREIGILSIIGVTCTLFAALIFLPAILRLLDPQYTYSGGPGDEIG
jgi:predicted RND superfamily exporter protein